jgi:DNA-binding beta-propeller fold protein YncE
VIDTATNKVTTTVDVGKGPLAPVLDTASGRLYVPNWVSGSVSVVDLAQ